MYIYLADLVNCMDSFQEAYFDPDTSDYKRAIDLLDDEEKSLYLRIPMLSEEKIIYSYLSQINDKKLQRYFLKLKGNEQLPRIFKVHIENDRFFDDYWQFRREIVSEEAKKWCDSNNIKYTNKKKL